MNLNKESSYMDPYERRSASQDKYLNDQKDEIFTSSNKQVKLPYMFKSQSMSPPAKLSETQNQERINNHNGRMA